MLRIVEYLFAKIIKKLHLRAIVSSHIHRTSKICSGSHLVNVKVEKHSDIGYDCTIVNTQIGSFCSIASNVIIGGASHTIDWVSTSPVFNENKDHLPQKFSYHKFNLNNYTIIGSDVWIGNNALIKAGIEIGVGAVIGMGSVVTKNVGPYEIWAGNPAKLIRKRFTDVIINDMLDTNWWNWTDNEIRQYSDLFNDPPKFLEKYKFDKII